MKKSYDYFKTLKDLSVIVCESFACLSDSKTVNKNYLCFSALRNELSEKLIDEFIAPIERNDIYNLTFCLYNEFGCVIKLSDFFSLSQTAFFDSLKEIGNLFYKQSEVFALKDLLKMPEKGCSCLSGELFECKKAKKIILAETSDSICSHNHPLISYAIGSSCIETVSSIETAYNEIGRVLVNNS